MKNSKHFLFAALIGITPIIASCTAGIANTVVKAEPEHVNPHGSSARPKFDPRNSHSFREIVPKLRNCPEGSSEIERNKLRVLCRIDGETASKFELYPTPRGIQAHIVHERDLPREVNSRYPAWYRGHGKGYHADKDASHYYFDLLGDGLKYPGYDASNIYCASFYLRPGKTYFAHNHPTREFYYFFKGDGTWFSPGKKEGEHSETKIGPGTFIVNPPYIHHSVRNDSTNEELGALACWWRNEDDPKGVFKNRGLPLNPCLTFNEATSKGYPDYRRGVCPAGVPRKEKPK